MVRARKILYAAHCVLNQNSVIRDWERARGAFNEIVRVILESDVSIIQLPCPEFIFLGEDRPPMTKDEYDTAKYRLLCRELSEKTAAQMKEYTRCGYQILGVIGIQQSPSCDIYGDRGVFMEELYCAADSQGIALRGFEIPEEYVEGNGTDAVEGFRVFIENSNK